MILGIDDSFVNSTPHTHTPTHMCRQVLYNFSSCTNINCKRNAACLLAWHPSISAAFSGYLSDTFILCHPKVSSARRGEGWGRVDTSCRDALLTYAYVWLSFVTILHTWWKCAQIVVCLLEMCCDMLLPGCHNFFVFYNKLIPTATPPP